MLRKYVFSKSLVMKVILKFLKNITISYLNIQIEFEFESIKSTFEL